MDVLDCIGNTPLIKLKRIPKKGRVFVKLESSNVGGSIKDRAALFGIRHMLKTGAINKDTILIESSSGNTGIGLALVAAALGMKMIVTMPESMSLERRKLISAYGAQLVLTPASEGVLGASREAQRLEKELPNAKIIGQFTNKAMHLSHSRGTAPELISQCNQYQIDPKYFVSCWGTGGTFTGCAPVLKAAFEDLKVVVVEPKESPTLSEGKSCPHCIQGIAPNVQSEVLEKDKLDEIALASYEESRDMIRKVAKEEALMLGISSGAALHVAIQYAEKHDCDVLVIAADSGERYLSCTGLYD